MWLVLMLCTLVVRKSSADVPASINVVGVEDLRRCSQ